MNALALQQKSSPIANLEEKTDTKTATAPVNKNMAGSMTQLTGQYIYDRFIANDDEEITKMGLIRGWVAQYDTATVKKALADAVAIAKEHGEAALKTMRNHQTVMRLAYGAIKFARPQLEQMGYTDKTGYLLMRVLGKKALEQRGLKWDGSPAKPATPAEVRERQRVEKQALANVKEANPQKQDESIKDYTLRIADLLEDEVEAIRESEKAEKVKGLAEKFHELAQKAGVELKDVFEHLLETDFEIVETDEQATM